jgi:hypothetical protein
MHDNVSYLSFFEATIRQPKTETDDESNSIPTRFMQMSCTFEAMTNVFGATIGQ